MTVAELREKLRSASREERLRLLSKTLREARDTDVWRFTSLQGVLAEWPMISRQLGRRRPFWEFLLGEWRKAGLDAEPPR